MSERITKDDIIRALLDASFFCSAGATSLKDVADRLGIKKASLYNHFASRDDLFRQATASCAEYIDAITFAPPDIQGVAKKYPAETVLKGIVNRYFRMHEKTPLFQIYTFVESQKYFSKEAADIVSAENSKLIAQTDAVLEALRAAQKITLPKERVHGTSVCFCAAVRDFLNQYLMERKVIVAANPDSGEGQLFAPPPDGHGLEQVNACIGSFAALLKS
ncbi:MAG TPA: hypothetical protein DDW78_06990 [Treponema sp.]|nr:hypothetical protein [Treponema sp.]